jgi:hypothetical protein
MASIGARSRTQSSVLTVAPAQAGLWFGERLDALAAADHAAFAITIDGDLDVVALGDAGDAVVERYPVLRSVIAEDSGGRHLRADGIRPAIESMDLSTAGPDAIDAITRAEIGRAFDLRRGPLCRMVLIRLGARTHRLLVVIHDAVFDARSTDLFVADLAENYRVATRLRVTTRIRQTS